MAFDAARLMAFLEEHEGVTRESLVAAGHLPPEAPAKGTALLAAADRDRLGRGAAQARQGRAVRAALRRRVDGLRPATRDQQELLTLALPRSKAGALDFMRASTELAAAGTWQDPDSVSNDERADNVLLEVQFGEIEGELVGHGIVLALSLINNLEVNEQVLYARMINVEETTLIL